jgi:hypothetical protein
MTAPAAKITIADVAAMGEIPHAWTKPQPLPDPAEPPLPFDGNALLPDAFRDYVADAARRLSAPPDLIALPLMTAAGATLGRAVGIRPKALDDWTEYANLWGMIIAPPSSMKSPGYDAATQALRKIEKEQTDVFLTLKSKYETEMLKHEAIKKAFRKSLDNAARDGKSMDLPQLPEPTPPVERRIVVKNATPEKLVAIHAENPRGLLVLRDELMGWLRMLERSGREGERALFLEGWTGKNPYRADTISRGSDSIDACCLSVWGGIQPGPFREFLESPERAGKADGLLQRFSLLAWPEPLPYALCDDSPNAAAAAAVERVFRRFAKLNDAPPITGTIEDGKPPFLQFKPDAQTVFLEWLVAFMNHLPTITPESFQGHLSKYRKALPALALICELADNPTASDVSLGSWQRAEAWGRYLESHLRKIYAPTIWNEVAAAHLIGKRIVSGGIGPTFTTRELHRRGWDGLTDVEQCRTALAVLEGCSWIRKIESDGPGRPPEAWEINPQIDMEGGQE